MSMTTIWIICTGGVCFVLGMLVEMIAESSIRAKKVQEEVKEDRAQVTEIKSEETVDFFDPW